MFHFRFHIKTVQIPNSNKHWTISTKDMQPKEEVKKYTDLRNKIENAVNY